MGGFCLFQWLERKKKQLEKKNNFQSNETNARVVLVKWREKKPTNQQQNTDKTPLF